MRETWIQSLGWEDLLMKGKATHLWILPLVSAVDAGSLPQAVCHHALLWCHGNALDQSPSSPACNSAPSLQAGVAGGPWPQDHTLVWLPLRTWQLGGLLPSFVRVCRDVECVFLITYCSHPEASAQILRQHQKFCLIFYFIPGNYFTHLFMLGAQQSCRGC